MSSAFMSRSGALMSKLAIAASLGMVSQAATAEYALNMPVGVTEISREVYDLHMMVFYICCAIGAVVFGAMIYSIFAHRKSKGAKAANFHHSTLVEIVWTAVPFIILMAMALPAAKTLVKMENTRGAEMSIKITGYQWKWQYEYVDEDVSFYSTLDKDSNVARQTGADVDLTAVDNYLLDVDNPLVVPTGTKIRLLLTAADVIHAWWVPDFAVKKDAIPGYINETWMQIDEPGTYRGQCAELCGRDHGFMPVVVIAKTPEEYQAWLAAQKGAESALNGAAIATEQNVALAQ
jgi:cytochrome c oxidase subunit 2